LLSMLEQVDTNFTRKISVIEFTKRYCKDYKDTFLYLFRLYFKIIVPKQPVVIAIDDKKKKAKEEEEPEFDDDLSLALEEQPAVAAAPEPVKLLVTEEDMPYHYLMSFLLVLMSLPEGDLPSWVYWLCYTAQDKKPDHTSMEELIDDLWPKIEKNKEPVKLMRKKAQNLLIITDVEDLSANKLRLFDANTGGNWTRPVRKMRKELRQSTLGYFFWRRLNAIVQKECTEIETAYNRLKEPYRLSRWGKKNIAVVGERKEARKEVRVFVRLHLSYLHSLLEGDAPTRGSQYSGKQSGGSNKTSEYGELDQEESVVHYIYTKVSIPFKYVGTKITALAASSAQVFPMSGSGSLNSHSSNVNMVSHSSGMSAKLSAKYGAAAGGGEYTKPSLFRRMFTHSMGRLRAKTMTQASVEVNKDEFISLEVKYKEALTVPIETVYERVENAQIRAARMLAQCEEEVHFSNLGTAYGNKHYGISARDDLHRVPRNVIVDVSSSSGSRSGSYSRSRSSSGSGSASWEGDSRYAQPGQGSLDGGSLEELATYHTLDGDEDYSRGSGSRSGSGSQGDFDNEPRLKSAMKKR